MTQQIREIIDKGDLAIGVFVDFQKAFDTVNHKILLRKLEHYGIRGQANRWLSSYLTGRRQYVSIQGHISNHEIIQHGVPQGSVLGPLLFLVYINDLHTCIKHSTTRHFADDTNLLFSTDSKKPRNRNIVRNLNKDLKSLNHWLLANKISLNSTKTELVIFRNKSTKLPDLDIQLNGTRLRAVSEVKYVGITFDEHLTFSSHISIMNAKLKRANNLIAISRHYLSKSLLLQIYYGQFYSHLSYGCQLWGHGKIDQTITLQKKAIRLMTFSHYLAHTSTLFKELKLLKLPDIISMSNILFTHSTLNNRSPAIFNNFFKFKDINKRQISQHNKFSTLNGALEMPIYKTSSGLKSVQFICAVEWNQIHRELSNENFLKYQENNFWLKSISIKPLKNLLKPNFLDNY